MSTNSDIVGRIRSADWETLYPVLLRFAEVKLRMALASGNGRIKGRPVIEGMDANVLLDCAIDKTISGVRNWKYESVSLEAHLRQVIRSDISSFFKKGVAESRAAHIETDDEPLNPVDIHPDHTHRSDRNLSESEIRMLQRKHIDAFRESLKGDDELIAIFDAYEAEYTMPADIAEVQGMDARRVDELKRKFRTKYLRFTEGYAGPLNKSDLVKEKQ